jgi:hypothetical protein
MPSASKSRRARSRKRRPVPGSEARPARQQREPVPPASRLGERPRAPWHPLPLSEILILAGAIATVIGLNRRADGTALLIAGVIAAGIGTFEVTWREHRSGYRSHTILLAIVPVLAFHSLAIGLVSIFAQPTVLVSILLLPFDLALFLFLFKLLRAGFLDARLQRTVRGR